jgi:hypothetical protein
VPEPIVGSGTVAYGIGRPARRRSLRVGTFAA